MQVELHGHRGIHMSRCEQALFKLAQNKYKNLETFSEKLAEELLSVQAANKAYVSVEGLFINERKTKKSKLTSHDKVHLSAISETTQQKTTSRIGIAAYNITGCPCTETYTKFSVVPRLVKEGFDLSQITKILDITNSGTHTQRGIAKIFVDKSSEKTTHKNLFTILDKSCHLVFELLKRPDEHELVVRALKKPQFTEDVVREIAANCVNALEGHINPDSKVFISSLLLDSIHIHDVYTEIDRPFKELASEK
jgi:MptA/FolE2 family GTP cyclohydrolase